MAFNRSKFNREPFNTEGELLRFLVVSGLEEVDAAIGSALNFYGLGIGNEKVDASVTGVKAKFAPSASGLEEVNEEVTEIIRSLLIKSNFNETVTTVSHASAEVYPVVDAEETVNAITKLGSNIYLYNNFTEEVDASTWLGAKIYPDADAYEFVNETASLETLSIKTCYLNLTLRPGQILIVDANNYNVLLDGQNAIDIHSGDWIDELNRTTNEIKIDAAAGSANLTATILYTERFL